MKQTITIDLRPLRGYLAPGQVGEIAKDVGISRSMATKIIAGECQNWSFVQKFLQKVEANKALVEKAELLNSK